MLFCRSRTQKSSDGKTVICKKDRKKTAKALSQYIDLTPKQIEKILKPKGQAYQVEFGNAGSNLLFQQCRRSRIGTCQELILLRLQHVNIQKANLASQENNWDGNSLKLKNDNGTEETNLVGQLGLEGYFNKQVKTGINGLRKDKQDVYGYQIAC